MKTRRYLFHKQRRAKYMSVKECDRRAKDLLNTEPYILGNGDIRDAIHYSYKEEISRFKGRRGENCTNELRPNHIQKVGLRFMRYEQFPLKPTTYWSNGKRRQTLFISELYLKTLDDMPRSAAEKKLAASADLLKNKAIALPLIGIANPDFDLAIFGIKGHIAEIINMMKNDPEGPATRFDPSDCDNPYTGPSNEIITEYLKQFSANDFLEWAEKRTTIDMKDDPRRQYHLLWVYNLGRKYTNRKYLMEYLRDKAQQRLRHLSRSRTLKRNRNATK